MPGQGRDGTWTLPDGRVVEYWEGGDPTGRPVIFHPGTPASRWLGRWGHEAAAAAGVRLVSVNRPGYGGSTPVTTAPSLRATGQETAALAASLGMQAYAVLGISGGGPFALATAVADPESVRALGVVGGKGPWRLLDEPVVGDREDREYREYLAQLDDGDVAGARAGVRSALGREMSVLRPLDDAARVDALLDEPASHLFHDHAYRALWAANIAVVLDGLDGYVFDNLAWGGTWDVDPHAVVAPTVVWDGEGEGCRLGRWYAELIAGSELVLFPGEGHLDVGDGHWPEVLTTLLRVWL